ncbi:MAG: helix-turn-helix domain-containing protein [Eubacteriales bacterium]
MNNSDEIRERTCPVCGKTFVVGQYGWAYKILPKHSNRYTYLCSYSCLNRERERMEHGGLNRHVEYLHGLRRILFEREISVKTAAKICGIHPSQMNNYVYLDSAATAPTIEKIARGLGVTAEELVGGKKNV